MSVRRPQQCWKSCANGSNIIALRFGDHGTKEMLEVVGWKVWPVSNFAQQHAKTSNNMQQGVQTDATSVTSNKVGSCWPTMLLRLHGALVLNRTSPSLLHTFVVVTLLNFPLPFNIPEILSDTNTSRVNTFGRLLVLYVFVIWRKINGPVNACHSFYLVIRSGVNSWECKTQKLRLIRNNSEQ